MRVKTSIKEDLVVILVYEKTWPTRALNPHTSPISCATLDTLFELAGFTFLLYKMESKSCVGVC